MVCRVFAPNVTVGRLVISLSSDICERATVVTLVALQTNATVITRKKEENTVNL